MKRTCLLSMLALIILSAAAFCDDSCSWIPDTLLNELKEAWKQEIYDYPVSYFEGIFGLKTKVDVLSCSLKNPYRLIEIDYESYKEGDNIYECMEFLDGYGFGLYCDGQKLGGFVAKLINGAWEIPITYHMHGKVVEDYVGDIYKKYPASSGYEIYSHYPEIFFIVKDKEVIEVIKWDYSKDSIGGFPPSEHMLAYKKFLIEMKESRLHKRLLESKRKCTTEADSIH